MLEENNKVNGIKKIFKNKIIVIACLLVVVIVLIILIVMQFNKECSSVDDTYQIFMKTVNGDDLGSIEVCASCSDNTYSQLPTLNMSGYTFSGWYYDMELTKKVDESVLEMELDTKRSKTGCIIGYEDIVVYAKFDSE